MAPDDTSVADPVIRRVQPRQLELMSMWLRTHVLDHVHDPVFDPLFSIRRAFIGEFNSVFVDVTEMGDAI